MRRAAAILALGAAFTAIADMDIGRIAMIDDLQTTTTVVERVERNIIDQYHHDVAVTNLALASGQAFAGLVIESTNLVSVVPVIGTTAVVRVFAPFAQGHYTSGMFSAIEIGDFYQLLFAQRLQIGTAAYFPSPSRIRFTDSLNPGDEYDSAPSLQDMIDAVSPERIADYLAGAVQNTGDNVISGSLTVDGLYVPGELRAASGAVQSIHVASAGVGRIYLGDGGGSPDFAGQSLTNITFGGTREQPSDNLRSYMHRVVSESVADGFLAHAEETRSAAYDAASYDIVTDAATSWTGPLTTTNDYSATLYQVNNYSAPPVSGVHAWVIPDGRTISVWRDNTFAPPPAHDGALTITNNWQRRYKSNNSLHSSGQLTTVVGAAKQAVILPWYPDSGGTADKVHTLDFKILCDYSAGATLLPTSLSWHGISGTGDWRIVSGRADALTITAGARFLLHFLQVDEGTLRVTREDLSNEL